ncbi:MAG: hypothetical protein IID41_11945 [Planctomycetes bacterium]|nr:hypothetical protein [Planctomycetota bacterium]
MPPDRHKKCPDELGGKRPGESKIITRILAAPRDAGKARAWPSDDHPFRAQLREDRNFFWRRMLASTSGRAA